VHEGEVRQASEELSPGREPHWFGWRRPFDLAMADSLTVITRSRTFEIVLRSTIMRIEAGESKGGLAGLVQDHPVGGFERGRVISKSYQVGEEFE